MNKKSRIKVGVIGCGNISNAYFHGMGLFPDLIEVAGCADIDVAKAAAKAKECNVPWSGSVDDILANREIDLIVNLTIPAAHAKVNMAALKSGKHAYCEKPFSVSTAEGKKVLAYAKSKKLKLGTAPDTFLGAGLQTCRKLIDEGVIGKPVAGFASLISRGVETWHSNPEFYYKKGGGPMFDMGPYYLTAMVHLMGPIKRVAATAKISFPKRLITSQPFAGKIIKVEALTHYSGTITFANGAIVTMMMTFDVCDSKLPRLEIYGEKGTLSCPDPNHFHLDNSIFQKGIADKEWQAIPLVHPHRTGRGMGVADMAKAILTGRPYRCNGDLGYHIVEVMEAFEKSSKLGRHVNITSTCKQPKAFPANLETGGMD